MAVASPDLVGTRQRPFMLGEISAPFAIHQVARHLVAAVSCLAATELDGQPERNYARDSDPGTAAAIWRIADYLERGSKRTERPFGFADFAVLRQNLARDAPPAAHNESDRFHGPMAVVSLLFTSTFQIYKLGVDVSPKSFTASGLVELIGAGTPHAVRGRSNVLPGYHLLLGKRHLDH